MDVAVIGLGLIGGSVLRAMAAAGHRVTGYDPGAADRARAAGFAVAGSIAEAVERAELVVLAVPLPALPPVIAQLTAFDGLITDVTSVKGPVRELAAKHGLRRFVGGHPMAGKETSGFAASDAELFRGCAWVLTLDEESDSETGLDAATGPDPDTGLDATTRPDPDTGLDDGAGLDEGTGLDEGAGLDDWLTLAELVIGLGARVVPATSAQHDRAVAEISHVPHLVAAALAGQLAGHPLAAALAAGSFRDGTRVAATRAEMIVAMCGGNRDETGRALDRLLAELAGMREALRTDPDRMIPVLRAAGDLRRAWPVPPGEEAVMPAERDALLDLGTAGGWVAGISGDRQNVIAIRTETGRNSS